MADESYPSELKYYKEHDWVRVEGDLAVVGISELATPEGRSARLGSDLGRLRTIADAAVISDTASAW